MTVTPYLNMAGNAEEALNFYHSVFGGEVEIMRWSEMPPNPKMPVSDEWKNKIMHASLAIQEGFSLFFSDSMTDEKWPEYNPLFLQVEFDSESDLWIAFNALSAEGFIHMPVERTFWGGVYGNLVDKFGVGWGLHYQIPE